MGNKTIFSTTNSYFKYGATTYYLTDLTFNENFDKIEVTDTATSGDGKEYKTGRAERSFTVDLMYDSGSADLTLNTATGVTASFEGKFYLGQAALYTKTINGTLDSAIKASYEGSFNGSVTVTPAA